MADWTVNAVFDAVAAAVPHRTMTVCGSRRSTFAESRALIRTLAGFLVGCGLGVQRPRAGLTRWECGQDRVALIMHNDAYVEAVLACLRARVVPVNVNHLYTAGEVRDLLDYIGPTGVIYHRSLAPLVHAALPAGCDVRIAVDDGGIEALLPGTVRLDDITVDPVEPEPAGAPDDLMMVCTGGTTGRPKGVMWRQADAYISTMTGTEHNSVESITESVAAQSNPFFAVSPLMHTAGLSTALTAVLMGRTAIVYDNRRRFDPAVVWLTAEQERAVVMSIVGDAYAGPLADELSRSRYDLAALTRIGTGGAATHPKHKRRLLRHLPHATIADTYGSSETGGMAGGASCADGETTPMVMHPTGAVASADRTRFLEPGDPEIGWVARIGRVPLGYFGDRAATERTFPEIGGRRAAIPGDRARLLSDGTIEFLGRDSLVINTGGEKVFVEEVEKVLTGHPAVVDAVVTRRPHERWGSAVVAVVVLAPGDSLTVQPAAAIREFCAERLAGFKVPKDIVIVEQIRRLGNGKADYRWAQQIAARGS
ncbi:AMP-binding protein [Mycolicibacterium fortuitum]|uniref:Acyl-CoA synthetase n=1 Tax=Mycolicibacterium fortuitum subsp. fortuitum DSM 46621 = ATCC 6841 = JCM 6387 TaxID=1214102 RepID=K0V5M2_MYCFO|nr:AMP-binding protein [Mycolicibacterium fortuitum]AIY46723.1 Long-chain fatty-acid-CoA ligase, Mycobacterial subgroup FadD19 [Mycobacterium sp. VKM Ac-1817D]CRL79550.1 acyl-CoA synthetase [Mycolicibacter nonchromogenicus]EJZ06344.1 acyl-CoA synthetase [Mycolicibacterium fortuitum subsp. fortuitum DSM 46621 = ATCC 6841 = JCM 6387]WEV30173.1 AMP-binding protein [Mycolicibacterium fortuitum]CRL57614.1 acyl-CoA synthetase [Mycolicibacterium fortuitum subsp. fortuitum DSM 46621 = ATCC 6841 = JCM 